MDHYALTRTVAPAVEPVSVAEFETHSRTDSGEDDSYLSALIAAARDLCERTTGRAFINQTWALKLDYFRDPWTLSSAAIHLPRPPLSSVTSITYVDTEGVTQTLDASYYDVDTASDPGRVLLGYNDTWPSTRTIPQAVTITYVAGYGAASASVPDIYRQAIKLLAAHWYENREQVIVGGTPAEMPWAVRELLAVDRVRPV